MPEERDRFEQARRHEPSLNGRQREVLELLVAGKTNGEIGDLLGITLDGAKWNVSEILGKLGLTTREEAAAYWRWRSRPAARIGALRGLASMGALKWAGAGAAVIAGVAVLAALTRNDTSNSGELPPFYLEARIEVTDRSGSVGASLPGYAGMEVFRTSDLKWWQEDIKRGRWEVSNSDEFNSTGTLVVADGKDEWIFSGESETYTRQPLQDLPSDFRTRPLGLSMLIGPGFYGDATQFLDSLKGWGGPDATLKRIGSETVLGRKTTIYEFSPAVKSSSGRPGPTGEIVETETGDGFVRIWLDEERVVVMRYASESSSADVFAEVTMLDWDADNPDTAYRFDIPPGATEEQNGSDSGSTGTSSSGQRGHLVAYTVPEGFLEVGGSAGAYLPYGWSQGTANKSSVSMFELRLAKDDGPSEIVVTQRRAANGLPQSLQNGERISVSGEPAWRSTVNGQLRYTFLRGGIAVIVLGTRVTEEELLAVAESLEPPPP